MKSSPRIRQSNVNGSAAGPVSLLRRMLFGHLRLKARAGSLLVTWGETLLAPAAHDADKPKHGAVSYATNDERARVLAELAILLNAKPSNRQVLRHLVFFESAFAKKGYKCLDDIPVKTLRRVHEQLQLLASSWSSRDLEALALRMASALQRRGGADALLDAMDTGPSTTKVEVLEGRLSDFFMLADEVIVEHERNGLQPARV